MNQTKHIREHLREARAAACTHGTHVREHLHKLLAGQPDEIRRHVLRSYGLDRNGKHESTKA